VLFETKDFAVKTWMLLSGIGVLILLFGGGAKLFS